MAVTVQLTLMERGFIFMLVSLSAKQLVVLVASDE